MSLNFVRSRAQRVESMRRARNCQFYAQHATSPRAAALWQSSALHAVKCARLFNWQAVARLREYTLAVANIDHARAWHDTSAELSGRPS